MIRILQPGNIIRPRYQISEIPMPGLYAPAAIGLRQIGKMYNLTQAGSVGIVEICYGRGDKVNRFCN